MNLELLSIKEILSILRRSLIVAALGVCAWTGFPGLSKPLCSQTVAESPDSAIQALRMREKSIFRDPCVLYAPQAAIHLDIPTEYQGAASKEHGVPSFTVTVSLGRVSESGGKIVRPGQKHPGNVQREVLYRKELRAPQPSLSIAFPAPVREGVYEIVVTVHQIGGDANADAPSQWSLTSNPLHRKPATKLCDEYAEQFVVLNPNPLPRPVGEWNTLIRKELVESEDSHRAWWKRLPQIQPFPRVGNLSTPKLPEIARWNGFRDRSSHSSEQPVESSEKPLSERLTASLAAKRSPGLMNFLEQWISGGPESYGSGHFKQDLLLPAEFAFPNSGKAAPSAVGNTVVNTVGNAAGNTLENAKFSKLEKSVSADSESWQAFPLPVRDVGQAHLLEIDYPIGIPQSLEIGVLELLDDNGRSVPVLSLDGGFCMEKEIASGNPGDGISQGSSTTVPLTTGALTTYRVLFWPKTQHPMLFLRNRDSRHDAWFADIRLFRVSGNSEGLLGNEAPRFPQAFAEPAQRLVAAYVHRPDFFESLSSNVENTLPENNPVEDAKRGGFPIPDDWQILFEGSTRLVEQLRKTGYDGAVLNVANSDGILYPSRFMGNVPEGRSAEKDSLELLLRIFDRENLLFIPALDFDMPLAPIEARLLHDPDSARELLQDVPEPIGVDPAQNVGRKIKTRRYNPLHPEVQAAMLEAVRELSQRYSRHPSFGGLVVQLSPEGYAQLPDPLRDLDDRTIRQFETETEATLPGEATASGVNDSPQRFAARARHFQADPASADVWIRWRAQKIADLYARMSEIVAQNKPGNRLYLAGGTMLDEPNLRQFCMPTLTRRAPQHHEHVLRMLGFDLTVLSGIPSLTFLCPQYFSHSDRELDACYAGFDSNYMNSLFTQFGDRNGALSFFDARRDFSMTPAAFQARRRFVRQLAQSDVRCFFDGGFTAPCGADEPLLEFLSVYRRLPTGRFENYVQTQVQTSVQKNSQKSGPTEEKNDATDEVSLQPVTVRFMKTENGLVAYLLNDAPFPVRVDLTFGTKKNRPTIRKIGRRDETVEIVRDPSNPSQARWQTELEPYGFAAVELDEPTSIRNVAVHRPESICGPDGELKRSIDRFARQIQIARTGIVWPKLKNPGCEDDFDGIKKDQIAGWYQSAGPRETVQLDRTIKHAGLSSLKLSAPNGMQGGSVVVSSTPFEAPSTGRLFVSLVVGIPENAQTLPLNVVLTGRHRNGPFGRSFHIDSTLMPLLRKTAPVGGVRWHRIVVPFDRLPTEQFDSLQLGFELFGPGTVWIDDVTMYGVALTKEETNELLRLVSAADLRHSTGRFSDLLTILDGYAARFLARHVPDAPPDIRPTPSVVPAPGNKPYADDQSKTPPPQESPGMFDRFKGWFGR